MHQRPSSAAGRRMVATAVAIVGAIGFAPVPVAQETPPHLSSVVGKLSNGDRVFGVSTYDLSLENARSLARSDIDYVYVDMEHGPMDFAALQAFLLGMIDASAIADAGRVRHRVTPLARLPPYGRESSHWAVKQALDIGLMGVIFPSIETAEQARNAVRAMRYPPRRGPSRSRVGCAGRGRPPPPGSGGYRPRTTCRMPTPGRSTRRAIWWPS